MATNLQAIKSQSKKRNRITKCVFNLFERLRRCPLAFLFSLLDAFCKGVLALTKVAVTSADTASDFCI